jgi:hypothetical protein
MFRSRHSFITGYARLPPAYPSGLIIQDHYSALRYPFNAALATKQLARCLQSGVATRHESIRLHSANGLQPERTLSTAINGDTNKAAPHCQTHRIRVHGEINDTFGINVGVVNAHTANNKPLQSVVCLASDATPDLCN